jgi:hypothetical protein
LSKLLGFWTIRLKPERGGGFKENKPLFLAEITSKMLPEKLLKYYKSTFFKLTLT